MTAPRRRICVMQIPSARKRAAYDNVRINNTVARRAGAVSFGYFSLPPKKSNIKHNRRVKSLLVDSKKLFVYNPRKRFEKN